MIATIENDILFDDLASIEAIHGADYLNKISITDNMDCTNNIYSFAGNEKFSAKKIARTAA